ncbi:MAG: hypothetical protein LQ351_001586 [Letrouitia transgressa]|nr:MAG: hypothetical protein LQ351_001586 [Letrouitia transgressa]
MVRIMGRRVPKTLEFSIDDEHFAISSSAIKTHFPSLWEVSRNDIRKGRLHPKRHARPAGSRDRDILMLLFQVLEIHDHQPTDRGTLMDLRWITELSDHPSERAQVFHSLAKLLRDESFGCHEDMAYQLSEAFVDDLPTIMMAGPELWVEYVLALDFIWKSFRPNFMGTILKLVFERGISSLELQGFWERAKLPLQKKMASVLGYTPSLVSDVVYPYSDFTGLRCGNGLRRGGQRLLGPIPELHDPHLTLVRPALHGALPHNAHLNRHRRHRGGSFPQITDLYEDRPQRPQARML